jgi:membrane protease YdiL (CAAX protease family)
MKALLLALGKSLAFIVLYFPCELVFIPFNFLAFYFLTGLVGFPEDLLFSEWRLKTNKAAPWTAALAALLAAWIMTRLVDRRPFGSLGLKFHPTWWKELLLGIFIGSGLVLLLMVSLSALGLLGTSRAYQSELERGRILVALALALPFHAGVAVYEEMMARGYVFQMLARGAGVAPAVIISSLYFAVGHHPYPWGPVSAGLGGLLMALAYWRTRSLWWPIGIHFAFDYLHYLLRLSYKLSWQSTAILAIGISLAVMVLMRFAKPHVQMESLWQQYVPIAQPWAQLKAWWARRKNKTGNAS